MEDPNRWEKQRTSWVPLVPLEQEVLVASPGLLFLSCQSSQWQLLVDESSVPWFALVLSGLFTLQLI